METDTQIRANKQNSARNENWTGNAIKSMRFNSFQWGNCEIDSNEIDEREGQFEKHSEQRISTLEGIIID
jgi:hypothetical protein